MNLIRTEGFEAEASAGMDFLADGRLVILCCWEPEGRVCHRVDGVHRPRSREDHRQEDRARGWPSPWA